MANIYIEDTLAPVAEESTLTDLPVTGTIPGHLDGRYLRNGPNPVAEHDPDTYHWFTGDGMVHGIRIRDGVAQWYRNRYVRTPALAERFGEQPPADSGRAGFVVVGANTNVIGHAGRTLALIESGLACSELTDDLDTVGTCDFDGTLTGGYTAHPLRDPDTDELHAISYSFAEENTVRYSVIDKAGRARRRVDIAVHGNPMMHGFALTEHHVVIFDLPVTFDLDAATGGARFPYTWNESYPSRIGVMPRESNGTDVRWFDVDRCYIFHQANAYEAGNTIVLDAVRHDRVFDRVRLGPGEGNPTMTRWVLDLVDGTARETRLDDRLQELPRIDERLIGRPHRYAYALTVRAEGPPTGSLLKHDFERNRTDARDFGTGHEVGEFVFVPSEFGTTEDDGILMGFVLDRASARTDLVLLDAGSLDTVAAIHLPSRVPHGFHGNWVPTGH